MISYDTIISNFDDKVTLYNWLRKVEEALKNASATNFVVNKKGNATLSFSITFADGTTLESGDIVLQQGESVDDARIAGGILQLHLTNGTWLTAGNVKPVSNFEIDASQHLIVNYADGTSEDLGAIFNGNVSITGHFKQGTANYVGNVNISGYSNRQTFTTSFVRVEQINQTLHCIECFKATQTGETTDELYLTYNDIDLPTDIASKIIDIDGNPATTSDAVRGITYSPCIILNSTKGTRHVGMFAIVNVNAVNRIRFLVQFTSYTRVEQNDVLQVYARTALTLL